MFPGKFTFCATVLIVLGMAFACLSSSGIGSLPPPGTSPRLHVAAPALFVTDKTSMLMEEVLMVYARPYTRLPPAGARY